jgi:FK506-binding nuclear protein
MAAIDPSAPAQTDEENQVLRATLKLIRVPMDFDSDEEDDEDYDPEDIEAIAARLREAGALPEESSDEDDSENEKNGGPSDPVKSKKAKQAALTKKLQEALEADEMEIDSSATNGVKGKAKGKAKITDAEISDEDDEDDDEDDEDDEEPEEFVLCTLNPENVRFFL